MEASESKFSFYNPPVGRVNYVKEADLYGIYRYIVDPKYAKRQTDTYRALLRSSSLAPVGWRNALNGRFEETGVPLGGKGAAAFKGSHFAYCLFSGTFGANRKNDGLQQHSGLLCLDFDHLTSNSVSGLTGEAGPTSNSVSGLSSVKQTLLNDQYFETLLLFVSPSGNGLKWVIPIDLDKATHEQWYTGVSNYLRATYGLLADPACKNVARACFLPHDPDCYIAPRLHREFLAFCGVPNGTCKGSVGESGGLGRFNGSGGASPCDPSAERAGALTDLATMLGATNIDIKSINE